MSDTIASVSARANAYTRHRGPDHPVTIDTKRLLGALRIERAITTTLATAPPLTDEQADRLAALLRGGVR